MERDEAAYTAGCEAARTDMAAGRLIYHWSGHAGHWGHYIVTQLKVRFGLDVDEGFGVCMVTARQVSFNEGYNSVVEAEIDQRYGPGSLKSVFTDAEAQSEINLLEARQAWLKERGMV